MNVMQLELRGGHVVKSDGWEEDVTYFYVYEVAPNVWRETLTNVTWPG